MKALRALSILGLLVLGGCTPFTYALLAGAGAIAEHCVEAVGNCYTTAKADVGDAQEAIAVAKAVVPQVVAIHKRVAAVRAKLHSDVAALLAPKAPEAVQPPVASPAGAPTSGKVPWWALLIPAPFIAFAGYKIVKSKS